MDVEESKPNPLILQITYDYRMAPEIVEKVRKDYPQLQTDPNRIFTK